MTYAHLSKFEKALFQKAHIFKKNFLKVSGEFGHAWKSEFDLHLAKLLDEDVSAYINCVQGYSQFSIDAMRMQVEFNKELKYGITFEEAYEQVYMNEDYMMNIYLPGIFATNFLWKHHYLHLLYYNQEFAPLFKAASDKRFYDVGTGTGFYSVQAFRQDSGLKGVGIDISPFSRRFTKKQVESWGFGDAFTSLDVNIIGAKLEPLPFVQCVEVLEHLPDPEFFLKHLRKLLQPGGKGFITAALTAPEPDHIYLYWKSDDIIKQITEAGFKLEDFREFPAYEPRQKKEQIPKVAAFIVS